MSNCFSPSPLLNPQLFELHLSLLYRNKLTKRLKITQTHTHAHSTHPTSPSSTNFFNCRPPLALRTYLVLLYLLENRKHTETSTSILFVLFSPLLFRPQLLLERRPVLYIQSPLNILARLHSASSTALYFFYTCFQLTLLRQRQRRAHQVTKTETNHD